MPISRDTLLAIEQAAVRSWPALETADIDGWLWRYASGGSLRANSVAALAFTGANLDAAIAEAERRYRAQGVPCRFTIAEVSEPGDLDRRLEAHGYVRSEDHVTMAKAVAAEAAMPGDIELSSDPTPEWLAVYLSGSERRPQGDRPHHPRRPAPIADLSRLPPRRFGRRLGPHDP